MNNEYYECLGTARIMQFGKSVGIACTSFAVTNIDDMLTVEAGRESDRRWLYYI
jgi:hypothetical protein